MFENKRGKTPSKTTFFKTEQAYYILWSNLDAKPRFGAIYKAV